jgi:hypothetical protein
MKKTLLLPVTALTLGLVAWGVSAANAKEMKPVAVVSLAGYDAIKADLAYIGQISDNPDLDRNLEAILKLFTRNQGLAGLDKSRPWGAVIQTDGADLSGYAFLPVSDLKKLLGVLAPIVGEAHDVGDGVLELKKDAKPAYLKEVSGGWVVVADKRETLVATPADPAVAVAELNGQYDIAVRLYAANVPAPIREMVLQKIDRDVERDLKRRPDESEEDHAVRAKISREFAATITAVLRDLEGATLGWTLDPKTEKAFLDMTIVARAGSETASQMAKLENVQTNFAGFHLPGAALSGRMTGQMPEGKIRMFDAIVSTVRAKALADIEKESKPEEEKAVARRLVGDVLDVVGETVKAGRVDGGMSIALDAKAVTIVCGKQLVGAARLDKTARMLADLAKGHEPAVADWITMDAGQWQSVKLHTISVPIPDDAKDREKVVALVGERLDIAIGVGPDAFYLAAGRDAMAKLRSALEASAAKAAEKVSPLNVSVALRPIVRFVAEMGEGKDRARAATMASYLVESEDRDHIRLVADAIPQGVRYRLEIEPGVVRLLGKLSQMGQE